jgi:hypothetical protein
MPQAWGGAKPRCAHLHIDMSKISEDKDLRTNLFGADSDLISMRNEDSSRIMSSDMVDVYFKSQDALLVKGVQGGRTYEIDVDVITSITWC